MKWASDGDVNGEKMSNVRPAHSNGEDVHLQLVFQ